MQSTVSRRFRRRIILMIVIVCTVVTLHWLQILRPIETALLAIIEPGQRVVMNAATRLPFRNPAVNPQNIETLDAETANTRYRELQAENAQLKTVIQQSDLAREQLAYLESRTATGITARVNGRGSDLPEHTIVIDKGERNGVKKGSPVITGSGILIGIVQEVRGPVAIVELITSPQLRLSAIVQNTQSSTGIVGGSLNAPLSMEYIPQFDDVQKDQVIITSGKDPNIPAGLVIGVVSDIRSNPGTLFQQAIVQPVSNVQAVSIVTVISSL